MLWNFSKMIDLFSGEDARNLLLNGKWGLEKEALRVNSNGDLALTPHPVAFGEKTGNPFVTTDFSESQVELITPAFNSIEKTVSFLDDLRKEVGREIDNELLWPHSMPGPLPDDEKIPIARFSNTDDGKLKEIYRSGLALRYGKKMQMISGIHYNFSFRDEFWDKLMKGFDINIEKQAFINASYVALVRNILRYRWLLIYLFGASPIADEKYPSDILQTGNLFSHYTHYATSLRMSQFGYDSASHSQLPVSYNSLDGYIRDIRHILSTKNDTYSKIGIYRDGKQIQLNDHQLQLENEYYSAIRFKQIPDTGETQLEALESRGVEYLEFRGFDLNPFEKNGISLDQLYFTQVFMLYCLFEATPYLTPQETRLSNLNAHKTALMGRWRGLKLDRTNGKSVSIKQWGTEIIKKLRVIARLLDTSIGSSMYENSIEVQFKKISNSDLLPSSQMINEMKAYNESYLEFNLRKARENSYEGNNEFYNTRV